MRDTLQTLRLHGSFGSTNAVLLASIFSIFAMVSGCAVGTTTDEGNEETVAESVSEVENQLDQPPSVGDPGDQPDPGVPIGNADPDPEPWRGERDGQDDGPKPDDVRTNQLTKTPGHHDD